MIRKPFWSAKGVPIHIDVAAIALLAFLTGLLYLPFLHNPLVFDDHVFFFGNKFAYFATHPFGLLPRAPAYFSLAAVEVLFGRIELHRLLSLLLHLACALALYGLTRELLLVTSRRGGRRLGEAEYRRVVACSLFAAGTFALHPASVYAAGYLVQRSIVLSTLFGLLSLWVLLRAMQDNRSAGTIAAAVLFSLAVLAKEHSILLPLVALPLAYLATADSKARIKHVLLYWVASAPAVAIVFLMLRQILGQPYEPHVDAISSQSFSVDGVEGISLTWPFSAATQLGLFFRYVALWIWPDTHRMAIDLRIDLAASWSLAWGGLKIAAFVIWGAIAAMMLRRGGRAAVAGFGLVYAWILFLVELSVLRFQEPFVIYRSYLWAPGIVIAVAAAVDALGTRVALGAFALVVPLIFYQAHDRLGTFSSALLLWEDAAARLPDEPVPWGSRVLYNLGREYLYTEQPDKALAVADRCMAIYPRAHHCLYARGAILYQMGRYEQALTNFRAAAVVEPKSGITQHRIGLALEKLGRTDEAKERYRKAATLGYRGGQMELGRLSSTASVGQAKSQMGAKP
ncbi:MAG: hypothetical protein A3I63_05680 [Betaproteobacteria bacterium RIFCSPLOWO2_02_FULL_66_14]|nr:MAG: hypothetical protein A3I63_05680 [Betaproteobacteria bacterium RIFCSPLOWO2_02_FULL_66_14]